MLTKNLIEKERTPKELSDFVIKCTDKIKKITSDRHNAFLKKGLYKEYIDEIIPLSFFCENHYDDNVVIKPIIGNQGYDAIVKTADGVVIDKIELTSPHDGASSATDYKKVVNRGFGGFDWVTPGDEIDRLKPFIKNTCQIKAAIDYKDCLLIIVIEHLPPNDENKSIYKAKIQEIINIIQEYKFKAKAVFLLAHVQNEGIIFPVSS